MTTYANNLYVATESTTLAQVWQLFEPLPAIPTMTTLGMIVLVIALGIATVHWWRQGQREDLAASGRLQRRGGRGR